MNKLRVIDLLNKIANGEELPNKFKFDDDIFYKQSSKCYRCNETQNIFEECFILEDLDKEIEIIEEDEKIKKLPATSSIYATDGQMTMVVLKINEIINVLNEMMEDK